MTFQPCNINNNNINSYHYNRLMSASQSASETFRNRIVRMNYHSSHKDPHLYDISYFDQDLILRQKEQVRPVPQGFACMHLPADALEVLTLNQHTGRFRMFTIDRNTDSPYMAAMYDILANGVKQVHVPLPIIADNTILHRQVLSAAIQTLKPDRDGITELIENYNLLISILQKPKSRKKGMQAMYKKAYSFETYRENSRSWLHFHEYDLPKDARRLILKVNAPIFEREPENRDLNTFDFIRVRIGVPSKESMPNRMQKLSKYKKQILKMVVSHLENNKSFQRYGVPSEFLKVTKMTVTHCSELEILFELKISE